MRQAREARAAREQALAAREEGIEAALVDFFRAVSEVGRINEQAKARADALLAEATRTGEAPWAAACAAVARLRELVGNNAQVVELCGLRLEDVRNMLAATRASEEPPAGALGAGRQGEPGAAPGAADELAGEPAPGESLPPPMATG